jgi:hypothetical protein
MQGIGIFYDGGEALQLRHPLNAQSPGGESENATENLRSLSMPESARDVGVDMNCRSFLIRRFPKSIFPGSQSPHSSGTFDSSQRNSAVLCSHSTVACRRIHSLSRQES